MLDLLSVIGILLEGILEVAGLVMDIASWVKSRPSRLARKEARALGHAPPPRNKWHRAFLILTPLVVLLGLVLAWRIYRAMSHPGAAP